MRIMTAVKSNALEIFLDRARHEPDKPFLTQPMEDGSVLKWTNAQVATEAGRMARYITSLGLPRSSHIAIISKNCAWWLIADLAIMMSDNVSVPVYPNTTSDNTRFILERSGVKVIFVGKLVPHAWQEMKDCLLGGMKCIGFPECPDELSSHIPGGDFVTWDRAVEEHDTREDKLRDSRDLATIMYTSGSTGR